MNSVDLMTIGVFARATGLTTSALRFYDECGLVEPAHVDPVTGYRSYAPEQIDQVVLIRHLRGLGLTLEDVRRLLDAPCATAERFLGVHLDRMQEAVEDARRTAATALNLIRRIHRDALIVSGRILAEAVGQVASAAEACAEWPVLGGILLEPGPGELRLAASDRYRLAIRSVSAAGDIGAQVPTVVQAKDLEAVQAWIGQQDDVCLRIGETHVCLGGNDGERVLSILAGDFPSYRTILDGVPEPTTRVVAPRDQLVCALGDHAVSRLDLLPGRGLTIRAADGQGQEVTINADVTGSLVSIHFVLSTLRPALAGGVGPDVMLQIARPDQPVVVRSADDGDFTTLIMPTRPNLASGVAARTAGGAFPF